MIAIEEAWPLVTVIILVTVPTLLYLGRTWASERIRQSVAAEYDRGLEELRAALALNSSQLSGVQATANAALLEARRAFAERRASAVDALWREVLRIRNESPTAVFMLDILKPSEYDGFVTDDRLRPMVPELEDGYPGILSNAAIEDVRPFVGEHVFTLFFIYRAVHGRICFLLESGVKAGKVTPWFEDQGIHQLLSTVLTDGEWQAFTELNHGHVGWMRSLIEGKMLGELRKIIAGEISTTEGLEQAQRVHSIMSEVNVSDRARSDPSGDG